MDILKIISISISCLIIIILLKKLNSDYALLASCTISLSICFFSFIILVPVIDFMKNLGFGSEFSNLFTLIFKSAGICILTSLASEICRDCKEPSIASKIELAARCTLLTMSLPLIKKVFENATTFID